MSTTDAAATLGAKLDALDLTEAERELLLAIVSAAGSEAEVSGFKAPSFGDLIPRVTYQTYEFGFKASEPPPPLPPGGGTTAV